MVILTRVIQIRFRTAAIRIKGNYASRLNDCEAWILQSMITYAFDTVRGPNSIEERILTNGKKEYEEQKYIYANSADNSKWEVQDYLKLTV